MVVFSSKSSSAKTKLFEQPLDKLFSPKAIKQLNEAISASSSRLALSSSLSVPLTSSTGLTWAKLSQDNSTAKRRRTLARLRRFTIDANNNANLVQAASCISSPPEALLNQQQHQQLQKLHASLSTAAISSPTTTTSTSAQTGATSPSSPQATLLSTLPNASIVQFSSEQHNHHRLQNNCASTSAASCAAPNQIDEEDERARLLLNVLPEPIKCLLNELYLRGPETVGIFRKSPNAKHCRELRQELEASDGQQQSLIEQFQVTVIASVFKEWLRSLPDCLLMSRLYPQWIDVAKLIEPLHLDKQHQQQLAQQISGNIDSYGVARNAAIASSSSSSSPSSPSPTSSIGNKQASAIGDALHRNAPLDLQSDFAANNVCGDQQQQRHQSERELSRALSCSAVTTASDSGHSSTSPSSSFEADSSSRSPPGPPYPMSLAITRSNHNLEMERQQQQQQQQQPVVGRYSRQRDSANGAAGRLRYRSEDLSRDNEQSRALAEMMRPPMSPFELRERHSECIRIVRQLLDLLNEANLILLRAIICVLWHIADNSEHNKMSAQNLGVCVGQSLLNDEHQLKKGHTSTSNLYTMRPTSNLCAASPSSAASALKHLSTSNFVKRHRRARSQCLLASTISLTNLSHLSTSPASNNGAIASPHNTSTSNCSAYLESSGAQEAAKYVPILVAFMIDNAKTLFGSDIVNLFGKQRPRQSAAAAAINVSHQRAADSANNLQEPNSQRECSNRSSLTTSTASGPPASQQQDLQQSKSDDCVTASTSACVADTVAMSDSSSNNINADLPSNQTEETITSTTSTSAAVAAAAAAGTTINDHECRGAQEPDELKKPVPITATQRLCRNLSSDLVIRSSTDLLNNSAAPSAFKQHRRNPSTSIVVQIGAIAKAHDFSRAAVPCERSADGDKPSAASCSSSSEQAGTTTSILIVNTPKRTMPARPANDCQASNQSTSSCCSEDDEVDSCRQRSSSQSVSPSCGSQSGCSSADSQAKQQQQQQRPLSAAESTSSSSRASSSTSGVHSESPALSSETDTRHHCGGQATTCSSSMSASISSPDPSSSTPSTCTSPVDMVDGQNVSIVDKASNQSTNGGATTDNKGTSALLTRLSRRSRYTGGERPKSMVSLSSNELLEFRSAGANSLSPSDVPLGSCNQTYTSKQQQQQLAARDYVNFVPNQQHQQQQQRSHSMQSQTLNRYSSASSHQVATDRTPKLPFQYTTSCYGGEAVLYYPSNAHLSQHKRQKQQPQPQAEPRQEFQPNYRVCTRIQSLDRHHAQHQQPWDQQHQAPQRSHVMMLRDYYLSLQQQQQQRQQLQQQRRSSPNVASINHLQRAQQIQRQHSASQQPMLVSRIHHQHTPSQNELARLQYQQQQQQQHGEFAAQAHGDSLLYHQQSAAAYQRIQPRLAKVRANQFNSLYVKRAPSPSHLVVDAATITAGSCASNKGNSGGLIVRPLGKLKGGHCGPASIMAVSQSSLSQQSSKMSSTSSTEHSADDGESDDCSTGEWMESTMV